MAGAVVVTLSTLPIPCNARVSCDPAEASQTSAAISPRRRRFRPGTRRGVADFGGRAVRETGEHGSRDVTARLPLRRPVVRRALRSAAPWRAAGRHPGGADAVALLGVRRGRRRL